jgi:hypothetical protein
MFGALAGAKSRLQNETELVWPHAPSFGHQAQLVRPAPRTPYLRPRAFTATPAAPLLAGSWNR